MYEIPNPVRLAHTTASDKVRIAILSTVKKDVTDGYLRGHRTNDPWPPRRVEVHIILQYLIYALNSNPETGGRKNACPCGALHLVKLHIGAQTQTQTQTQTQKQVVLKSGEPRTRTTSCPVMSPPNPD